MAVPAAAAALDGLVRRRGDAVQRLAARRRRAGLLRRRAVRRPGRLRRPRARREAAAAEGLRRLRFATGVDEDHREFHARFRRDRYIGRAVRAVPELRVRRRPDAVGGAGLRDLRAADRVRPRGRHPAAPDRAPSARRCAGDRAARRADRRRGSPASRPPSCAPSTCPAHRALTLRRAAIEVAPGRVDLDDATSRLARLRAISGIGPWTLEMLAAPGPAPLRPGPGRRPRLHQARRPAARPAARRPAPRSTTSARFFDPLRRVAGPRRRVPHALRVTRLGLSSSRSTSSSHSRWALSSRRPRSHERRR